MFFKRISVFRFTPGSVANIDHDTLSGTPFSPCAATEPMRAGWVAPYGESLVFDADGRKLITLKVQRRVLPAGVVRDELERESANFEKREGRRMGRKEKQRLKDEITLTLLAKALTKDELISGFITADGYIIIGAQQNKAQLFLNALRLTLGSLPVRMWQAKHPPSSAMTSEVAEPTGRCGFTIGSSAVFSDKESTVKVKGIDLLSDEAQGHLAAGREVTSLELDWGDSATFMLSHNMAITGIQYGDIMEREIRAENEDDAFSSSFVIASSSLHKMIIQLGEWLGVSDEP